MRDPYFLFLPGLGAALLGWVISRYYPRRLLQWGLGRTNYQGQTIATAGGIWFLAIAVAGLALGPLPEHLPSVLAVLGFGLLGLADDLWGTSEFKGFRGHLRAVRQRRITTGACKAFGGMLLAVGLAGLSHSGVRVLSATLLIALTANLFNLLDLRPLRALKVFWLITLFRMAELSSFHFLMVGASLPYSRLEARRSVMLGDTGANALGGLIGVLLSQSVEWPMEGGLILALVTLHLWAEKHSLSAWIDRHAWAKALDDWGWQS